MCCTRAAQERLIASLQSWPENATPSRRSRFAPPLEAAGSVAPVDARLRGTQKVAHDFRGVDRVDHIPVRGDDSYTHQVPVHWIEYIPVNRTSGILVCDEPRPRRRSLMQPRRQPRVGATISPGTVSHPSTPLSAAPYSRPCCNRRKKPRLSFHALDRDRRTVRAIDHTVKEAVIWIVGKPQSAQILRT